MTSARVPPHRGAAPCRPPLQGEGKERARELRRNATEWERRLWSVLRRSAHKFRRQVPIGPYIADFACHSARLIIELDGQQHDPHKDARRDAWFATAGYRILRFTNAQVERNLAQVLNAIDLALASPPPGGEGDSA